MQIKPAQVTLNALRDGQTMNELAQAIHDATCAMREHNKPASVTLTISFEPMKGISSGLKEAPINVRAEVTTKLPKTEPPTTIMYLDEDNNPTRNAPERQPGLGLTVASNQGSDNAS